MSKERNEEWELSKENIRPIHQGRKQKVLKVALTSHTEDVIEQQRQSFESELRTYSGDDLLSVWCKYLKWVEQNFPKGYREGHIKQLIERCLSVLKDEKKYHDDDRYVDIMLKYAIIGGKPIDVYAYMFRHNIGCKSAKFFINWSWELEQLGSLKKAEEILIAGIQRKAEPLEKLCSYHKDFEIRLAEKIKSNSEQNFSTIENSHSTFAILKPQAKNLPPVSRTGEAVIDNRKIPLVLRNQPQPQNNSSGKVPLKIHTSENINSSLPLQLQPAIPGNLNSENYKETEQKPGKLSKSKVRTHDQHLKTSNAVQQSFKFHCDGVKEQEIDTPRSVPKISKISSTLCNSPSPPMALFEPPDPSKRPMYPKTKVYGGAEELSLEEIRAADWFDSRKKIEQEKLLQEQQKKIEEQQKQKEELEKKVEYLAKQVELLKSHLPSSIPTLNKSSDVAELYTNINCLESVKTDYSKCNKKLKTEEIIEECYENSIIDVNSNLQSGAKSQPTHDLNYSLKNKPSGNSKLHHTFEKKDPDGTGLFEAEKLVQEFYNKTLSQSITDGEHMPTLTNEFVGKSSVISATNMSNLNEANQHGEIQSSILKESNCDLQFTFYHDPTAVIADSREVSPSRKHPEKQPPFVSPNEASSEEDIENIPPKDYAQESSKRELAGILEPSKNILFIPLEEQEETDDSDIEEENYICHNVGQYTDDTLIPPSNTEQFSAAQFLSSTPYIPRNKSPILERSEHQIESPKPNIKIVQHLSTGGSNANDREFVQDNIIRTELMSAKEQSSLPRGSKMLSVIMETSAETYSKSSSSSSASLTRSHNIDQLSSHRISMLKQCSKLETGERSALSSVSEVSHAISDINCQSNSEISLKKSSEIYSKFQLHTVDFDPFDQEVNFTFLSSVNMNRHKNLFYSNKSMRLSKGGENVCIGNEYYRIMTLVAEGAYAKVFEAVKLAIAMNVNTKKFALKVSKNSNEWEFYVCSELQKRLSERKLLPDIRNSVMNVISAEKYLNGIILVTDFGNFGTLLDTVNFCKKQNSAMPEFIVMYFTLEILLIVSKLHDCNIIHGDIKPDNFLLTNNAFDRSSTENLSEVTTSLQLIDFGRAVDLNFYDKGICFTSTFSKDHFKCNEMKDKRPWVFQLDWYGVASCVHTMLFSDYMMVRKKNGVWGIEKKLKRYWCTSLWDSLFNDLLNIPECYQEPNVKSHISIIESKLQQNSANFLNQFRRFANSYATER